MLIYTLLFTLKGREAKKNKYIQMFYIWLSFIIKYACLLKKDTISVLIDDASFIEVKRSPFIKSLLESDEIFTLEFIPISQPETIKEGICERYREIKKDTFTMFLDLDICVIESLQDLVSNLSKKTNILYVYPEGDIANNCYSESVFTKEEKEKLLGYPGFSAGFFMYFPSDNINTFFNKVKSECLESKLNLYTVDQPFFNKVVYSRLLNQEENTLEISILNNTLMIFNNTNININNLFINFAGEPGNDSFHFEKMLDYLIERFIFS